MTELLHMKDNYLREFEATVVDITENAIILDRTAFYPEGGGQIGDTGILQMDNIEVSVTTTKKAHGQVLHLIDGVPPFKKGDLVVGKLNWGQRYECMRFHTAQHILSRYLQMTYGLETVGNQISCGTSRADYSPLESIDDAMKMRIADDVNEILSRNMDVKIEFMPRDDAIHFLRNRGYQYRYLEMVPPEVKEFRIVIIGDYDAASCAGTHVSNTREIGSIRLGKTKNVGAGKRRIYFSLE